MSILALVHPTDLLAVELRESLERRRDLWDELRLFSTDADEIGTLSEVRGAAAVVQKLEADSFDGVDVAFFGGAMEPNRPWLARLPAATAAVLLSADAEDGDGRPIVAGVNLARASRDVPMISPHPAVVALAHLLSPLAAFAPRVAAATLIQPVSMHGQAGLDEVLGQTRAILSFADSQPRDVFPVQMVFNAVPAAARTAGLERLVGAVLGTEVAVSIQMLQAGIFHSFSIGLYVELGEDPGPDAVRRALADHPANDLVPEPELLGPIDAAARDEVLIGRVEAAGAGRYRLWAVMDNLTCGGALNALQILEAISHQATQ